VQHELRNGNNKFAIFKDLIDKFPTPLQSDATTQNFKASSVELTEGICLMTSLFGLQLDITEDRQGANPKCFMCKTEPRVNKTVYCSDSCK